MGPKSQICKWASSLVLRILKHVAGQWAVHEGSTVEMDSRGNRVVMRKKTYSLDDMLATVTDENLHPEVDTGSTRGNEAW
ncbi:MAG: AbrB/MazE/SpoVT family DNA-binding domain-containing protein [Candidatus Aminicenantes bacterium]|nr:AbrB/MazE/SpoVT family DNA-binding domain-containing protein [Candidatus Aminicenantes bacterium]